jgi:adenylyl-sulfate kinase
MNGSTDATASNLYWHHGALERGSRAAHKGQKPCVIWLTGLSASGKSTVANALEQRLHDMGRHTMLLDGDNVRHGLNRDLGFSEADRVENIRRVGEVARLMTDAGLIVITAFISPYRSEREMVRDLIPIGEFVEVYVSTPLSVCEQRDPKGIYKKARSGEIPHFTGISAPYQMPESPEILLDTTHKTVEEAVDNIIDFLCQYESYI